MRGFVGVAAVWALSGCAPARAVVPQLPPRSADLVTRQQAYDEYHLEYQSGVFTQTWRRKDGEYGAVQLEDLADSYAETADVRNRAYSRAVTVGAIGGVGGGLIGGTLGYNLAALESKKMSDDVQIALYSTGAGLIVLSICIAAFWHDPLDDFADVYNDKLRLELGLPPSPLRAAPAAFVPRRLGLNEFGWVF